MWNECQFFMLDDRWYRTVETENGTILGEQQKYWIKEALLYSRAPFKFVCIGGQVLNTAKVYENYANYEAERAEILQFIDDYNIKGVVFITGDRHHSEISKLVTDKGNIIYDVTSSAITSGTGPHEEPNTLRVPGSMIGVRNFAKFKVSGERKNRKLSVEFKNSKGEKLFEYELK
jgi:alkaline phosphatase D